MNHILSIEIELICVDLKDQTWGLLNVSMGSYKLQPMTSISMTMA